MSGARVVLRGPGQQPDQRLRGHAPRPRGGGVPGHLLVAADHDHDPALRLGRHEVRDHLVGDHALGAEDHLDAPGRGDHGPRGRRGRVEDDGRLYAGPRHHRRQAMQQPGPLGLQRRGRPGRLAHVVAVDDQPRPGQGEVLLEQGGAGRGQRTGGGRLPRALARQRRLQPVRRRPGRGRQRELAPQAGRGVDDGVEQQPGAQARLLPLGAAGPPVGPGLLLQPGHLGPQLAELLLGRRGGGVGLAAQLVGGRPASSAAESASRRADRASPSLRRSVAFSAFSPATSSRCRARRSRAACSAASTCCRRRSVSALVLRRAGRCARAASAASRTSSQPSGRTSQATAAARWRSILHGLRRAAGHLYADPIAELLVGVERGRHRAGAQPGSAGRGEVGHLAQGAGKLRDARQRPRRSARGCDGGPRRGGRRGRGLHGRRTRPALVAAQPFAGASASPSARDTTSIASARPHQRQVTASTDSSSTSVSSTRWSPARSKCQNSVVRRVLVTSKRVMLPHPPQRHR